MAAKASDVFVDCLQAEGVRYVFGIPGEETLDLNESLADSEIEFVAVRHEQGGAYMADMYGRLTGVPGVCLGTLGPGATNLVTGVADAYLDHAPLVALTGQGDLERMHKDSHQYIDTVSMFRPIAKWNARLQSPAIVPEAVRKAFRVAVAQKPGPTHLELPEDVREAAPDARPLPVRHDIRRPMPSEAELERAAELIRDAEAPIVLAGNGLVRVGASQALREFARVTGIPIAETFMGKGLLDYEDEHFVGTVGLQSRDYALAGFEEADLVITAGFDLVEHAPSHWNPNGDKRIVAIDTVSPEVDENYMTAVDLIGNGLAGMGLAVPTAIAAKLVHPERKVVTVNGDGGFLMNFQELETARRLGTATVNIVWENGQYGSIVWKQDKKFGRHFGVDFTNPDFVELASSFGLPAWRCESVGDFSRHLEQALALDVPSLIVLPIDYSIDVAISEELGRETV